MSLGDYVLNGGEVAVLAMVEAVGRLLPGVVGNPESLVEESHSDGLLEYPVYTKPSSWRDREVPAVLLSGNHGKIAQWRRHEQYRRTAERRPDLLEVFDAGKLPRADRTAFGELGYDVVDGRLQRRPRRLRRSRSGEPPIHHNAPECGKISLCACWVANLPQGERDQQRGTPAPSIPDGAGTTILSAGISGAQMRPGLAVVTQRE